MKLGQIRKIQREDIKGGDVPAWIDTLLGPLNIFIENVALALQGRLTFEDNFLSKIVTQELTHNTSLEINPSPGQEARFRAIGVIPLYAGGLGVDEFLWSQLSNGNISVKVNFSGGSGTAFVKLLILYQ